MSFYAIKEDKYYGYIQDLHWAIIRRWVSSVHGLPQIEKQRLDDSRQHGGLFGVLAQSIQDLLKLHVRWGIGKC